MQSYSFSEIVALLNEAGVRYLIVGGWAVAAHGYVRNTDDIDLVIALDTENILSTMKVFEGINFRPRLPVSSADFADPAQRASWITEKHMVVFQLRGEHPEQVPVDIFVTEPFDFDAEWNRAYRMPLGNEGPVAPFVSFEQLVALKNTAGRSSDLIDIEKLLKIRENFNK